MVTPEVELVVAKYKEDISWTEDPAFDNIKITIYDKSDEITNPQYKYLPNIGNEAHTYLWHMVINYDYNIVDYRELTPYTAFVQGNPFDHISRDKLLHHLHNPSEPFVWLADLTFQCDWQALPHHPGLPLAQMYAAAMGRISPAQYTFGVGGQFMVSKERIHNKPLYHYEHNLNIIESQGFGNHPIWCGYERFWDQLFE